jgi:hypothetical protein
MVIVLGIGIGFEEKAKMVRKIWSNLGSCEKGLSQRD